MTNFNEPGVPTRRQEVAKVEEQLEGFPYQIRMIGGMKHICDQDGNPLSNGYHEFKVYRQKYKDADLVVLLGKTGSMSHLLKVPEAPGQKFREMGEGFHNFEFREDLGYPTSMTGAMTYVLDPLTGEIISDGYHEITKRGGSLYGRTGAREGVIRLRNERDAVPSHDKKRIGDRIREIPGPEEDQ